MAFERATWSETSGWISDGAEGPEELEKREPPKVFLLEEVDFLELYSAI